MTATATIEELLRTEVPCIAGSGPKADARAEQVALFVMRKIGRRNTSASALQHFTFGLMHEHWLPRCNPKWAAKRSRLLAAIGAASKAYDAEQDEAAARLDKRVADAEKKHEAKLQRDDDDAEAAIEQRSDDAELHKTIARRLKVSVRQARNLRTHGTTSHEQAKRLAAILGTNPREHMRGARRRGPRADLVGMFMRARVAGAGFTDFIRESPAGNRLINALKKSGARDFANVGDLVRHVRKLDFTGGAIDAVWLAFTKWKIATIADMARLAADIAEPF